MPKGVYRIKNNFKCTVCGADFVSQKKSACHCSSLCLNITWRANNKDKDFATKKRWVENNPQRHANNQYKYKKKRLEEDFNYKLRQRIRSRLGRIRYNKSIRTLDWLGCSMQHLKEHLESKFQPGMAWDNYGEWHIDHIRPLSSFDLTKEENLRIACHYTNLQPLWARDNLSKGKRYP